MPYSTGLSTPLANFEANQNYKDTVDPSVMVNPSPPSAEWTSISLHWVMPRQQLYLPSGPALFLLLHLVVML